MTDHGASQRGRVVTTALFALLLVVLVARATPTRVGDGGEYFAMAMNLSRLQPPALSPADLARAERRLGALGPGYRIAVLRFPDLRARDGRQDFPHFWAYPLLTAPLLAATDALGWHPNHAFALANVVLLTCAWWFVIPHLGLGLTSLVLLSPIIWWVDKAHSEAFTFALLTIAFGCLTTRPVHSLVALGLACAQYPPLAVTLPVVMVTAWRLHGGESWKAPGSAATRPLLWASLVAIGLAAVPIGYYLARLGMVTPLTGWTSAHVPSLGDLARFVADPNIGLAWTFPWVALVTVAALAATARRAPRTLVTLPLLAGPICALLLLVGIAQSLNINHGATPGVNRQSLWLVPLALPLWVAWRTRSQRHHVAVRAVVLASVLLSLSWYAPRSPERYLSPTKPANWLWRHAPGLDNPPLEIFAERASHTEPPLVPIATPRCTKALVRGGRWPVPCAPQPVPVACQPEHQHCYANASDDGYDFVPVTVRDGVNVVTNPRTWPTDPESQRVIRTALANAAHCGARVTPAGESGSIVRATAHVAWTFILQCESTFVVYAASPLAGAQVTLRLPHAMIVTLDTIPAAGRTTVSLAVARPWAPVTLDLPASRDGVLITFR